MAVKQAIKYMLISSAAFACMNATVKYVSHVNSFQIVFFRSIGSLFFTLGYLFKHRIPILGKNHKLLILRSIVGGTSMLLFFTSIKYLSVGTAVSLRYLAPIFAAILAVIILHEKIKPIQWLFFVISFVGVIVLKGLDTELDSLGLLLVLLASFLSGLVYIIIHKIGNSEHPVVIVNYFMIITTVIGGILAIPNWITPTGIEWLFLLSLGIYGYFGQIFMTKAFQTASTNLVAPLKYVEVIYTVLLGIMIFGEIYTFWSLFGIILIICGLVLNVWYKSRLK